ncbi:MAG: hypothetical protein DHS20C12_29740 [Pseudohongiella sp.]|nr:MAG: hypothetical protein DHS20C12_29740 [Pseudohongiella sp.]
MSRDRNGSTTLLLFCLFCAFALHPGSHAHHASDTSFDTAEVISLEGVVKHFEWINPHTVFHVEAPDPQGRMRQWRILGGTPNSLLRNGINRQVINSLLPGTTLNVGSVATSTGQIASFRGYFPVDGYCNPDCILLGEELTFFRGGPLRLGNLGLDTLRIKP